MAAALDRDRWYGAVRFGQGVSAVTITRLGVIPALPTLQELAAFSRPKAKWSSSDGELLQDDLQDQAGQGQHAQADEEVPPVDLIGHGSISSQKACQRSRASASRSVDAA